MGQILNISDHPRYQIARQVYKEVQSTNAAAYRDTVLTNIAAWLSGQDGVLETVVVPGHHVVVRRRIFDRQACLTYTTATVVKTMAEAQEVMTWGQGGGAA